MNEIEYELSQENRDKKRTAASASKRVGLRKGCKLPYEMMPSSERKKYMQASEVTVFTLRPMTLAEFKKVPGDKQIELLKWYGEKYGWNAAGVAAALNSSYATGERLLADFMLTAMFKARMKECTKEQKAQFMANRRELEQSRQNEAQEAQPEPAPPILEEAEIPAQADTSAQMLGLRILLNGERIGSILERHLEGIAHSLDGNARYMVELSIVELPSNEDKRVSNVADA